MSGITEAALLREVARVQHDKTLQAVRDLVESIPTWQRKRNARWPDDTEDRHVKDFRADLIAGLQQLRDREATP